ncbi:hypothetical protein DPEC_G00349540 [Dallia pectoralis]|uniref:Uncharacterized protein n=1 Tax=Dallia pectoralis TaxID=75939 RepID=A0ACC2F1B0_DALPE|nr:hypothetical protein DPEC_G00349540 [Dallia pectoralis]
MLNIHGCTLSQYCTVFIRRVDNAETLTLKCDTRTLFIRVVSYQDREHLKTPELCPVTTGSPHTSSISFDWMDWTSSSV